jgi:hypothetical protein
MLVDQQHAHSCVGNLITPKRGAKGLDVIGFVILE